MLGARARGKTQKKTFIDFLKKSIDNSYYLVALNLKPKIRKKKGRT